MSVLTPRPSNDLVLISLEHDNIGVSERGATDGGIGIISYVVEVTKHDVVREDIGQGVGILSDATWDVVDWRRTSELSPGDNDE